MKKIENPATSAHFALIEPVEETFVASVGDTVLAKTSSAIRLLETSPRGKYPPVLYFPKSDVADVLTPVPGRSTHCALKGDASYLSLEKEEVAWIYDRPLPSAELLADYVGFYSDKVSIKKS